MELKVWVYGWDAMRARRWLVTVMLIGLGIDWSGDRAYTRSTTGYCTFIGGNMVTWNSKKQKVVSCSSAEANYRAMIKLTNELVWIKGILKHLEIEQATPMTMHCAIKPTFTLLQTQCFMRERRTLK